MKTKDPVDLITQFAVAPTGHVAVYAGDNADGTRWRVDEPVIGWALVVRSWPDGDKETDIKALVMDGEQGELMCVDDVRINECIYVLPPHPSAEDVRLCDAAIERHLASRRPVQELRRVEAGQAEVDSDQL